MHERRVKKRPSFKHVRPQLLKVATQASAALGRELLGKQRHSAELVELIYDNRITAGKGWDKAADLHKVLRVVAPPATESEVPIEQISVASPPCSRRQASSWGDCTYRQHPRSSCRPARPRFTFS